MTEVTLQIVPKTSRDVCVVNVAEDNLTNESEHHYPGIHATYCRIIHEALYRGHEIQDNKSTVPSAMAKELTHRMNTQIVPYLVKKGITCIDFFKIRDHQEIKASYPEYADRTIYEINVFLKGCIDENQTSHASTDDSYELGIEMVKIPLAEFLHTANHDEH